MVSVGHSLWRDDRDPHQRRRHRVARRQPGILHRSPGIRWRWLAFQLERHVLPIVRMMRGHTVFHAGAVETDRGALFLLADGQGGKSTTTALLLADGATFISDDQTAVTTSSEAIGTPWLRLRQASVELAPAGADVRIEGDGRTVVALVPRTEPIPIAGQVFCAGLVDPALIERHFRVATDLAANLPVARLCVPHGPPWPNLCAPHRTLARRLRFTE